MEEASSTAEVMKKLQALYKGIPDDSVDLTFKYLTTLPQNEASEKKKSAMKPTKDKSYQISEQASSHQGSRNDDHSGRSAEAEIKKERLAQSRGTGKGSVASLESSMASTSSDMIRQTQRKGTPHANICALCDLHVFIFRHRCLVCGRVYCKNCVRMGMGEMIEGRKCIECLGRRFSQMYIGRAGKSACCCGYLGGVKVQELIWAEKGASRSCEEKSEKRVSDPNQMNPSIIPIRSLSPTARKLKVSASFPLGGK